MAEQEQQHRRRFDPVPIETTFSSSRKGSQVQQQPRIGPAGEPTPDASPRSASPAAPDTEIAQPREPYERRRFAPQLIETSRRARRVGDAAPATRPADKTDITPWTKNIYNLRPKARRRLGSDHSRDHNRDWPAPPTRRESEDEGFTGHLLEWAAKEAEKKIQEAALAAFPNSRPREGGVAHFYFRDDSSGSDKSPQSTPPAHEHEHARPKARRQSSDLGLNWWHKHMQDHVKHLAQEKGEPPAEEEPSQADDDVLMRTDSDLDRMDLPDLPDALWITTSKRPSLGEKMDSGVGPSRDSRPLLGKQSLDEDMVDVSPAHLAAQAGIPGFGRPPATPAPRSRPSERKRPMVSPPMLGSDLTFRQCPSPKWTKLEPTDSFLQHQEEAVHRDSSEQRGLWRGYCYKPLQVGQKEEPIGLFRPQKNQMLITPYPGSPEEDLVPDTTTSHNISEEPSSVYTPHEDVAMSEPHLKNGNANDLHDLGPRLQREKVSADRDDKISQEFNDEFVTQVYNYLSLGYPAVAWMFDEELSKISHMSVSDLKQNDAKSDAANGHMVELSLVDDTPEDQRCPRWKALKMYIVEWARQHPDLDNLQPVPWGVRARRGSWAI